MTTFDGMCALITGSASGLGAATAIALARGGARVIVNYRASAPCGRQLSGRAPRASPRCRVIGSVAGRSLRQNRALGWPINWFLRDVAVGVIGQWDCRSDADDTAQQDIQRD
jgi:NAD(P)-dependent dehydrogenase (short-subunit alcohol dehydrogenase family)